MYFLRVLLVLVIKSVTVSCNLCDLNNPCQSQFFCNVVDQKECSIFTIHSTHSKKIKGYEKFERTPSSINITFGDISWSNLFLKISNNTSEFCSKISNPDKVKDLSFNCFKTDNGTYLLEYEALENVDRVSRKIQINSHRNQLFNYVDISDGYSLDLSVQPLNYPTTYKVEIWKEKNNSTSLQDLQLFDNNGEDFIHFKYFTYNDEGNYFFIISMIEKGCPDVGCMVTITPKIHIERKYPTLVIGIVGASFILPFVLFIFHILTKKYKNRRGSGSYESILIIYQASHQKNIEITQILAKLLRELLQIEVALDIISHKKICGDLLTTSTYIVYMNYPNTPDLDFNSIKDIVPNKEFIEIIFDLSTKNSSQHTKFKLMDEFDGFIKEFDHEIGLSYENHALFKELRIKIKEIKVELEQIPQIMITEEECHELIGQTTSL